MCAQCSPLQRRERGPTRPPDRLGGSGVLEFAVAHFRVGRTLSFGKMEKTGVGILPENGRIDNRFELRFARGTGTRVDSAVDER